MDSTRRGRKAEEFISYFPVATPGGMLQSGGSAECGRQLHARPVTYASTWFRAKVITRPASGQTRPVNLYELGPRIGVWWRFVGVGPDWAHFIWLPQIC